MQAAKAPRPIVHAKRPNAGSVADVPLGWSFVRLKTGGYELPMSIPATNTSAPPTTTWNTLVAKGLSMLAEANPGDRCNNSIIHNHRHRLWQPRSGNEVRQVMADARRANRHQSANHAAQIRMPAAGQTAVVGEGFGEPM